MVKIIGPGVASVLEKEDAHADVQSLVDKVKGEDRGKDPEVKVKLFLLLQNMDDQLLSKCLREISEYVLLLSPALSAFNLIIYPSSTAILFHSDRTSVTATCGCF